MHYYTWKYPLLFKLSHMLEHLAGFQHPFSFWASSVEKDINPQDTYLTPLHLSRFFVLYPSEAGTGLNFAAFVPPTLCSRSSTGCPGKIGSLMEVLISSDTTRLSSGMLKKIPTVLTKLGVHTYGPAAILNKQTKKSHLTIKTEKWLPRFNEYSLKPRKSFLQRGKKKPLEQQYLLIWK